MKTHTCAQAGGSPIPANPPSCAKAVRLGQELRLFAAKVQNSAPLGEVNPREGACCGATDHLGTAQAVICLLLNCDFENKREKKRERGKKKKKNSSHNQTRVRFRADLWYNQLVGYTTQMF